MYIYIYIYIYIYYIYIHCMHEFIGIIKIETKNCACFLLCNDGEADKIIIFYFFATDGTLRPGDMLANAENIYMDGTFKHCPSL